MGGMKNNPGHGPVNRACPGWFELLLFPGDPAFNQQHFRWRVPDLQSGFFIFLYLVGFVLIVVSGGGFETLDGFAHPRADFWQFPRSKNNQDNDQYDNQFRHSDSEHSNFLLIRRGIFQVFQ
jgi:hypothetical protein